MKAEIKPRIGNDRTPLQDVIPLSTPYLVFLDPSDKCNAKCAWCPTGSGEAKKYKKAGLMDWGLYRKIVDDLAAMPEPIKTLRLYMMGEPLLNPRFADMVRYAKDTGRFGQVDTTTNGSLLDGGRIHNIWAAGLDMVVVSVPSEYNWKNVQTIKFLYETSRSFNSWNSDGRREVVVKIIGDLLSGEQLTQFYKDFGNICDRIFIEHLAPCWPGFAVEGVGELGIYGQPVKEVRVCPYIFYSLAINSDGTVSLCFLDWSHKMIIGDLNKESFKDIWNGWLLRIHRLGQLQGKRSINPVCCNCGQLAYGAPDDIDQYADEILGRLK